MKLRLSSTPLPPNLTPFLSNIFNQVKAGKHFLMLRPWLKQVYLVSIKLKLWRYQYPTGGTFILSKMETTHSTVFHGNTVEHSLQAMGLRYCFFSMRLTPTSKDETNSPTIKIMFLKDSIKYLERLQQLFLCKIHHRLTILIRPVRDEIGFPLADTKDETIMAIFATANHLDSAVAFFGLPERSWLCSIIVLTEHHYEFLILVIQLSDQ